MRASRGRSMVAEVVLLGSRSRGLVGAVRRLPFGILFAATAAFHLHALVMLHVRFGSTLRGAVGRLLRGRRLSSLLMLAVVGRRLRGECRKREPESDCRAGDDKFHECISVEKRVVLGGVVTRFVAVEAQVRARHHQG